MPESSPKLFVTMGSVREDACRRGVPLDSLKFLIEANEMAVRRSVSEGQEFEHVHLIGDVSKVAEQIAMDSPTLTDAIGRMRNALICGQQPESYEMRLRPYVDEKIRVVESMRNLVGRKIRVVSALDFLRDELSSVDAMTHSLAFAYSDLIRNKTFDIEEMIAACSGAELKPDHEPERLSLSDLAIATLPHRFRGSPDVSTEEKMKHSFYSAAEGLLAGTLIEKGHIYASYRGSEVARKRSIIENMRLLVQTFIYFILKDENYAKKLNRQFIINPDLDGMGFREEEGVITRCFSSDPHTLDSKSGALRKIPLLPFDKEKGALRAVEPSEFRSAVIDGTGGIGRHKMPVWLANLSPANEYLNVYGSSAAANEIWTKHGVSPAAVLDWRSKVEKHLEHVRGGSCKPIKIDPLVPAANINAMADLIHQMAEDIMRSV
ncbi:hypothetical protein HZC21_00055 [Candidatus Peregrinibacteria bacterium]|nr:hypothetical protein [Candidatus Peregrinibacteria bacterium]